MKPPMQIALNRATLAALVTIVLTGLISYSLDHNVLHATILALSLAGKDLAVRGVVEGGIDTGRMVNAVQGEVIALPPINPSVYTQAATPFSEYDQWYANAGQAHYSDLPPGEPCVVPQNPHHHPNVYINRYGTPPPR